MGKEKNSVDKTVIINFLSIVLLQGISFITAPMFLRLLGTNQYGIFAVFSSWVSIISCFMGLGAAGGLATSHYDFPDQYYEFRSSNLVLGSLLSVSVILLSCLFSKPLSECFELSESISVLIFVTAFGIFVSNYASSAFIYEKKPVSNLLSSLSVSLMNIGVSFYFIWILNDNERYLARIFGYSVSQIAAAGVLWLILFLKKPTGLNRKYNGYAVRIGFFMIFHTLSNTVLVQSDRIMMQHMDVAASEIGIYTAYYSLASVLTLILTALNSSWCPYYYDDLKGEKWDELKIKVKRYLELFTVLTCGFLLLSREVGILYAGKEYFSGINILPVIAFSTFLIFMYQFPVNFEMYHKKTKYIAIGTVSAAFINMFLNFIGIKLWGMYGAAIATVLSYVMLFLVHYMIARNMKGSRFHMRMFDFIPWIILAATAFILFYVLSEFWYVRWGIGALIGVFEAVRIKKRRKLF